MSNNNVVVIHLIGLAFFPDFAFATGFLGDKDIIWEEGRNAFIKYADQDVASFGANDHPVDLQVEKISKALFTLRIPQKSNADSSQEQVSIFAEQQIETLSQYLAMGLANAKPNQDIIFSLEKTVRRFLGTRAKRLYVAGRAFYKDDRLNIIIGDYDRAGDDAFEAAYDPTRVGIVAYNFDHGRRTKSSRVFKKTSIKAPGVENKQLNGTQRNDWLVINLNSASEAVDASVKMREAEDIARKREELMELLGREESGAKVSAEMLPVTAAPASAAPATAIPTAAAPAPAAAKPATVAPVAVPATDTFEERLTTLKTLRDKGLITDEEYAMKRGQILEEL